MKKNFVLSIAGFDPCAGAGVLADIKVFQYLKMMGLGVASAITYQNDEVFNGVRWCCLDEIEKQLLPLKKYPVKAVKIGLIENFSQLENIICLIKSIFPDAYIVWDPILKATAGFSFHQDTFFSEKISKQINLISPNYDEYLQLGLDKFRPSCSVLLKGGHREEKKGIDVLMTSDGREVEVPGAEIKNKVDKHGTGCVLSAAIAAYIAQGLTEYESCKKAKVLVEKLIQSNKTNLGFLE